MMGTRIAGGKDHASPRYIFTRLTEITTMIFNRKDEPLFEYTDDDEEAVEFIKEVEEVLEERDNANEAFMQAIKDSSIKPEKA
jgi:regulator of sigma D